MGSPVVIVTSEADIAAVARRERQIRYTGEAYDDRINWPDRYTSKVENPHAKWGKRLVRIAPLFDLWLRGLGLALVIMSRKEAEERMGSPESLLPDANDGQGVHEFVTVTQTVISVF